MSERKEKSLFFQDLPLDKSHFITGGKGNTYHWDDTFGLDGYLVGHGAGNSDALMPHLQIHPKKGNVIRIFFGNTGGN